MTPPASSVTTPSASSVMTLSAVSSAATPFTSVATPLSSATPSPPAQLQLRPPPDLPPCTSSHVPLEACSPPKPPDPPDVPLSLLLLLLFDTTSSQPFSKSPDLKYPLLNLVLVFSHGVISLVYVDDTSFVSKCLSPAVCSVFLYWCVDWSPWGPVDWGPHRFSPSNFTCPPLPFITLVIVFVDSTMGCSIPIFVSLPLPLIQVLSQRFFNLILGDEFISLVWYFELSLDVYLFLALVRHFTALCSHFTVLCSPSTAVCSSISVVFKSFAQWQLNGLMPHIHNGNLVVYYPVSSFMGFVLFPLSSSTLCGFDVGDVLLKIRDTSNTEVLIKGFVAMLKIVDYALVAASILRFISLIVVSKFQGFTSLYSSMVAEIRGLLDIISCLSVLYAPIFLCCICFFVISVCLGWMVSLLCSYTFSIHGE